MNATTPKVNERSSIAFTPEDKELLRKCRAKLEIARGSNVSLSETMREALRELAVKLNVAG